MKGICIAPWFLVDCFPSFAKETDDTKTSFSVLAEVAGCLPATAKSMLGSISDEEPVAELPGSAHAKQVYMKPPNHLAWLGLHSIPTQESL